MCISHGRESAVRVDRLNEMEEYILSEGTVPLEKLAKQFDVSTNTVRRDVNELIKRGRIRKVYGGVSAITEHDTNLTPVPLQVRAVEHSTAKIVLNQPVRTPIDLAKFSSKVMAKILL